MDAALGAILSRHRRWSRGLCIPLRGRAIQGDLRRTDRAATATRHSPWRCGDAGIMSVTLICGDARDWNGKADLVLTNPYAPLPACLRGVPMLVSNFVERLTLCETYVGATLRPVGIWGKGQRNAVWAANMVACPLRL